MSWIRKFFSRPRPALPTYLRSFATFRFGRSVTEPEIEESVCRVPFLILMGDVILEKSMGEGYEVHNKTGDREDAISKEIEKLEWENTIVRGIKYHDQFGRASFTIHKEGKDENGKYSLLAFRPKHANVIYDKLGNIVSAVCVEKIPVTEKPEIEHEIDTPEKLKNYFHLVLYPSQDNKYEGIPKILKYWDVAHAHYVVLESMMVACVRAGYGVKKATIFDRGNVPENAIAESKIEQGLKKMDSGDQAIILWAGHEAGVPWEDKVEVATGDMTFDYANKLDQLHKTMSFLSGIPKNYLDGIFAGETLAGDVIHQMLQSALKELRDPFLPFIEKIFKRWYEFQGKTWNEEWKLVWKLPIGKLTEKEEADIMLIRSQTMAGLRQAGIIDNPEARTQLEMKDPNKVIEPPTITVDGLNPKKDEEDQKKEKDEE